MRILSIAAAAALLCSPALGADFGPLRGTQPIPVGASPVMNWEGGYIGAFAGYSQANFQNTSALRGPLAYMLRDLVIEREAQLSTKLLPRADDASTQGYGVFAGYNVQFDEAVLGFEVDFTRARMKGVSSDSYARRFGASNGLDYSSQLSGSVSGEINDLGTLRARAGVTMGSFLPYVTGGVALARATTTRTASVNIVERNPLDGSVTGRLVDSQTIGPKESFVLGYTGGVGVDMAITPNVMLRAEYQYIYFNDFDGYRITVNNVRAGAGIKF